jgi:hypothetical protein
MRSNKKNLLTYACALAVALGVAQVSCSQSETPTNGASNSQSASGQPDASGASLDSQPDGAQSISADEMQKFKNMLADVSNGVGQPGKTNAGAGSRRLLVFEEKHTSVASQFEIALMLLRLHERHGLRHVALEGLTEDKKFPDTQWFRSLGTSKDDDVMKEVLVGMLRDGEISAVELIAIAFPDLTVHAADDTVAYAVELTKHAGIASSVYLYKIGMKSVRPEHYARINQLNQQHKISELLDFVIAQDAWAKERHERMKKAGGGQSIEHILQDLREIEERARTVNAELTAEERNAMLEAKDFFEAADKRTHTLVRVTLGVASSSAPLVAVNIGAAHTEGAERLLDRGKVTYGVLTPLSHAGKKTAGELSYDSFERKDKLQSVTWTGKGLGSLLDGRRKPPPVVGQDWYKALSQLRVATVLLVRAMGSAGFPDPNLKRRIDSFDHLRVNWQSLAVTDDVLTFDASANGQKGWTSISTKAGKPLSVTTPRGRTWEELLLRDLELIRKEPGERTEPKSSPVIEAVTPDVIAAYAKDAAQLKDTRMRI